MPTAPEENPLERISVEKLLSEKPLVDGSKSGDFEVLEDLVILDKNNLRQMQIAKGDVVKIILLSDEKPRQSGKPTMLYFIRKGEVNNPGTLAIRVEKNLAIKAQEVLLEAPETVAKTADSDLEKALAFARNEMNK